MSTTTSSNTQDAMALVAGVRRWHQRFEILPGLVTPGVYDTQPLFDRLKLPADLSGKRVLDIGANDGFFAATCARRGAEVVAYDYVPKEERGFVVTEKLFDVSMRYIHDNLWNIASHNLGTFDIVLFLGVLYHLPDPFRGLALLSGFCSGTLYVETVCREIDTTLPVMVFTPGRSFNNDITNFWVPNPAFLRSMVEDVGFRVTDMHGGPQRQLVTAQRIHDQDSERRKTMAYGKR
jgi:tRNA (mo5U34)-methyltransferase